MVQINSMSFAIQECQSKEEEIQETRLNSAYKNALTKLTPERQKEFREVQRRWLAYRSASSGFYLDTGLSGYKITSRAVWLDLTASRVQELHEIDY